MTTLLFFDDWWLEIAPQYRTQDLGKPQPIPEATLLDSLTKGIYNFPTVYRDPKTRKMVRILPRSCRCDRGVGFGSGGHPRIDVGPE